jgi:hypothetical protein
LASGFLFFISELSGSDLMPEILQEIEDGRPEKNHKCNCADDKENGQAPDPDSNFGKRIAPFIVTRICCMAFIPAHKAPIPNNTLDG